MNYVLVVMLGRSTSYPKVRNPPTKTSDLLSSFIMMSQKMGRKGKGGGGDGFSSCSATFALVGRARRWTEVVRLFACFEGDAITRRGEARIKGQRGKGNGRVAYNSTFALPRGVLISISFFKTKLN